MEAIASSSHNDKQQLISDEWTAGVEKLLRSDEPIEVLGATRRVPTALVNTQPDAYIPQIVSLGPHHFHTLKVPSVGQYELPPAHVSQIDMYKLKFAREAAGRNAAVIEHIATELRKPPFIKKVKDFYDWSIADNGRELPNFSIMMTVDAFFLFQFLRNYFDDDQSMPFISSVRCDILKLENQIPLFLLLKVREKVGDTVPAERQQIDLESRIKSLSMLEVRPAATRFQKKEQHPSAPTKTQKKEQHPAPTKIPQKEQDLSTSQIRPHSEAIEILEGEEHLLGCIHKYVSSFLQIQTAEVDKRRPSRRQQISSKMGSVAAPVGSILGRNSASEGQQGFMGYNSASEGQQGFMGHNPASEGQQDFMGNNSVPGGQQDFLKRYNAEALLKAGITFRPLPDPSSKIRFDKLNRTLYLPKIKVMGSYTEVMLRNLMALEFNDVRRQKAVTNYVALMKSLIDTPKDVQVLRVRGVIVCGSMMITDEYVAQMWNEMCKPLLGFGGKMEAPFALKYEIQQLLIQNLCITRFKTLSWEFRGLFLAKPWTVIGLLVKIFLVLVVDFMFIGQYNLGWPSFKWKCPSPATPPTP